MTLISCRFTDIRTVALLAVLTEIQLYENNSIKIDLALATLNNLLVKFGRATNNSDIVSFNGIMEHCRKKLKNRNTKIKTDINLPPIIHATNKELITGILKLEDEHVLFLAELIYTKIGTSGMNRFNYAKTALDFFKKVEKNLAWDDWRHHIISGEIIYFDDGLCLV